MKTSAVVFTDIGAVELRDIEVGPPAPGEVTVRTTRSLISAGTESWILNNRFTWEPTRYPVVPGYQRVGNIVVLGDGVTGWEIGQRVVATVSRWPSPLSAHSGAHAGLANTTAQELYAVPPAVADLDAAGAVVAQVGYNAASRPSLAPGEWVLVYGDGLIGQCAAQAVQARGGRAVIVGHRPERLAAAGSRGIDATILGGASVVDEVRELLGNASLRVILDAVQTEASQLEYMPLLSRGGGGEIVYCGFTPGAAWADMGMLQRLEVTTHFVSGWSRPRMLATLAMMATGRMRIRDLVTHDLSPDQASFAYDLILRRSEPFLGIAFDWSS